MPFDEFDEITLGIQSSPYIIKTNLIIPEGKTLNIDPGVILKFDDRNDKITVGGTLLAIGNDEIIFTCLGDNPYPGCWGGIYFTETSKDSELNNVILKYGGSWPSSTSPCPDEMAGIKVEGSSVIIKNAIIEQNMRRGIFLINSSSVIDNVQVSETAICNEGGNNEFGGYGIVIRGGSPVVKNSSLENQVSGIYMREWPDFENVSRPATPLIENNIFEENENAIFMLNSLPYIYGNQAINNNINGILAGGSVTQDATWSNNLPYIINTSINIFQDITLTLDPGVILKFNDRNRRITVDGSLKAIGTEDDKIIFTSFKDEPKAGDWDQIYFSSSSFDSELSNVIVRYGGGRYIVMAPCPWKATAIKVDQASILLKDSIIEHNKYRGLWLINSDSVLDNVQVKNTIECLDKYGGIGIEIENGSPVLDNLTFEANTCNIFQNNECINPEP